MTPSDVKTVVANLDDFIELPDGIERLRKAVLTLAVAGSLVPHIAKEGTGKELHTSLRLTNEEVRSDALETELPFSVPASWALVRLDSVYEVNPRNVVPDGTMVSFLPMAKIHSEWSRNPDLDEEREWRSVKKGFTHIKENDVVLAKITPCFENEKSGIARNLTNGFAAGTTELHVFRDATGKLLPEYLLCVLRSPLFMEQAVKNMTGTAGQKRVPTKFVESFPFPLPPAAEQERIVKKVNEVMRQLDELERQKIKRDAVRARLARSAMQALGRGEKTLAFQILPELIKTPDDVAELEQAVLTLAVSGKLTTQVPKDGTGHELYDAIQTKRKSEPKRQRKTTVAPASAYETPFEIPATWKWMRFGDVFADYGSGSTPSRSNSDYFGGNVNWYKSGELNDSVLSSDAEEKVTDSALEDCRLRMNLRGDLLVAMYGATAGKLSILNNEGVTNQAVWGGTPSPEVDVQYLFLYMMQSRDSLIAKGAGAAQPNISGEKIINHPFPLPPFAEQKRIVEKFNLLRGEIYNLRELLP